MTSTAATPQVGDFLMLEGRACRIEAIRGTRCYFGAASPEEEAARREAMTAWKHERAQYLARLDVHEKTGAEISDYMRSEQGIADAIGAAPESSPNGTCSVAELRAMKTPGGVVWYLPQRLEAPAPAPGAVVLIPAEHRVNG